MDGGQHAAAKAKDDARTTKLEREGFQVVRFWNNDVHGNIEGVLRVIYDICYPSPAPSGRPLPLWANL